MYENAKYINDQYTGQPKWINVDINGINSWVSIGEENTDYQNIMKLVAEGKLVIAPADA